jgi:hypothetical protein
MTTPAARALQRLSPRVSETPIHNYLAREPRLDRVAEKLFAQGVATVRDFVLASETNTLSSIRMTAENRKRIERLLGKFGLERPPKRHCAKTRDRRNGHER